LIVVGDNIEEYKNLVISNIFNENNKNHLSFIITIMSISFILTI